MYQTFFKRLLDITISIFALIFFSPLMLYLAYLIKNKLGSPVIFKQLRPGKNEKLFMMYKFRSMLDVRDNAGILLSDAERLPPFGKKLRDTSLDELPELFNVLIGDMSIVGPRPQLVRDMVFMTDEQRQRHSVRQGITGLAQINGRNNISWEDKITYDLEYIKDISFFNDLKIIIYTFIKVFKKSDITTNGMDTAEDLGDYLLRTGKIDKFQLELGHRKAQSLQRIRDGI